VPIVAETESLQRREEGHEVAHDATGLTANELRDVRVALLRHQTAARAQGLRRAKEPKLLRGPHDDLVRDGRQVARQKGEVENELDEVVSISDRINRVLERSSESEDACGSRRIDRQRAPSERSCAQRSYVRADEAIHETKVVPDEGPDVSEQVVAYRHRLRPLKVGVAGHGGVRVCFGKVEEGELESQNPLPHGDDRLAYEQAFVERNLVVPTPSGVELRPERSEAFRERHLDIRVNVFEILPPNEATRGDLFVDASKAFPEELRLPFREDADRGEHLDEGVVIQGEGRRAAHDGRGALEQLDADIARDAVLGRRHERVERFPQRREPKAVVHEARIPGCDDPLKLEDVARQDERLEGLMGLDEDRRRGTLVHLAGLDADDARFDVVDPSDPVAARQLAQGRDQVNEFHVFSLKGGRFAAFEVNR